MGSYLDIRQTTVRLAAPLTPDDYQAQSLPEGSPVKWHLAHTTWFFETFVLRDHVAGYRAHDESWAYLFNSYYEAEGERHARPRRGMLSRPSLDEVRNYRAAVDEVLLTALPDLPEQALALVELGLHHEQQHQELMLMDIQATFAENPLKPALWPAPAPAPAPLASGLGWAEGGHSAGRSGFSAKVAWMSISISS